VAAVASAGPCAPTVVYLPGGQTAHAVPPPALASPEGLDRHCAPGATSATHRAVTSFGGAPAFEPGPVR